MLDDHTDPRALYEARLKLSNPARFSWENTPNPELTMEEIDTEMLYQTLHDGIGARRIPASAMTLQDPLEVMTKLGVARSDGLLLNAANALFGKDPTMHHIQCKVRLARFEGTDKRVFRDQTVCEGNLFAQYDAVIDFCKKHLFLGGTMDSKFRNDTLTVPYDVIKEATINMLCHRSWNVAGATPSLAIYDDRMEFQNPGAFPDGTSWRDFVDKPIGSLPPNPTISNVFYRRGTMEAWGRGLRLIMDGCAEQGLPQPEVATVPYFVNLTIRFKNSLAPAPQKPVEKKPSQKGRTQSPNTTAQASARRKQAFDAIVQFCETPRSVQEIANFLGRKDRKWVRTRYLRPLLGSRLELTIPERPRSTKQKYRAIPRRSPSP